MKKKILIIYGSPHKNGVTSRIIKEVTENLEDYAGIDFIDCYKLKLHPCTGCGFCSSHEGRCSIKDSMSEVYEKIKSCNVIILAAPMYFGMFPAPVKALIDRCQVLWSEKYVFGKEISTNKKGIFIFHGGSSWNNMFLPMETVGRYFFNTIGCQLQYKFYVTDTDKGLEMRSLEAMIADCRKKLME